MMAIYLSVRALAAFVTVATVAQSQILFPSPLAYAGPLSTAAGAGYETSLGDLQLRQAWEAAFSACIADGTWARIIGAEPAYTIVDSCNGLDPATGVIPYPNPPRGVLAKSLMAGSIQACVPSGIQMFSTSGLTLLDSTSFSPSGMYVDFANALMYKLAKAYNRRYMALSWMYAANEDACMDALLSGTVDVLPLLFSLGPYNGVVRPYSARASTCVTRGGVLNTWVLGTSSNPNVTALRSFSDLLAALQGPSPPIVGGIAAGGQRAAAILNTNVVYIPDDTTANTMLINGSVAVLATIGTSPSQAAQQGAQLRLLGANASSVLEMPTSYFRHPLVAGQRAPQVPTNSSAWPPSFDGSSPAAASNVQLAAAYLAGMNRVYAQGGWTSLFAAEPLFTVVESIIGPASQFPFPLAPTGVLASMLAAGQVRVGYNAGFVSKSPSNTIVLLDGTTNPPTGAYYALSSSVVTQIGTAYGVPGLSITWVPFASSDLMMDALAAGNIDMAPSSFSVGARYHGIARGMSFDSSLAFTVTGAIPIYVPLGSPYTSVTQLANALRRNPSLRIVTAGAASAGLAANFFGSASTAFITSMLTSSQSFDALLQANSPFVAEWDYSPQNATVAAQVTLLGYATSRAISTLFRPPVMPADQSLNAASTAAPITQVSAYGVLVALGVVTALLAAALLVLIIVVVRGCGQQASRRRMQGVGQTVEANSIVMNPLPAQA